MILYLERSILHHTIFVRQVLRGRPREFRTVQLEEAVLELNVESPETSTQKIINLFIVNNSTVYLNGWIGRGGTGYRILA